MNATHQLRRDSGLITLRGGEGFVVKQSYYDLHKRQAETCVARGVGGGRGGREGTKIPAD